LLVRKLPVGVVPFDQILLTRFIWRIQKNKVSRSNVCKGIFVRGAPDVSLPKYVGDFHDIGVIVCPPSAFATVAYIKLTFRIVAPHTLKARAIQKERSRCSKKKGLLVKCRVPNYVVRLFPRRKRLVYLPDFVGV